MKPVSEHLGTSAIPVVPPESLSGLLRELAREPESPPAAAVEPSLPTGTLIGRFELRREIGRGGFGIVYEAKDTTLGRSVAFKLVRGGKRMDLRRERLVREAEAAARVSHPNVVTLHDLGSSEHGPYLVLELLHGETLASRLRREPIATPEATAIAVQIARGLAHAHAAGVVHGDVTPGNVFLCSDGRVKLLDLGLARVFGSSSSESGGGTQGYVAPEVRSGAPASPRSDVYALGVVLFKMVAGTLPYRSDDDPQRAPLPLRDAPALAAAIERMVAADPADRLTDGSAALDLLEAANEQLARGLHSRATSRRLVGTLGLVGILAVAVVAGALGLRGRGGSGGSSSPPPVSLVVLPFADRSERSDQSYLSEGIADEVRTALGRVQGLRVVARQSSTSVDTTPGLDAAARTLGVSHLLLGSARLVGDRLEVDAELRDRAGGRSWARSYAGSLSKAFAIQKEIAGDALVALGLSPEVGKSPPRTTPPVDPEAFTEYLRGRQQANRGTPEGWRLAREAFERAVARAPDFAQAWSSLGAILITSFAVGVPTPAEARSLRERGVKALEKSIALDPNLADARSVRGFVFGFVEHDWPRGISEFDRALALEPSNPDTLRRYGHFVAAMGRIDDAIAAAQKAADRDPLDSKTWAALAAFYAGKGDLDAAERACRHSLAVSPEGICQLQLADLLLLESKPKDALTAYARTPEIFRLTGTAMAEHSLGHADRSRAALDELTSRYGQTAAYMVAQVHFWKGETDLGFHWLDRAFANGEHGVSEVRYHPMFRRVRGDPRFAALLRRLHLPPD